MGFQSYFSEAEGNGDDLGAPRGRSATISTSSQSVLFHNSDSGRRNLIRATPGAPMSPDRGRSVDQTAGTFYREGTPPPPPTTRDTNVDVSSTTNILNKAGEFYDYQYDHVAPAAPIPAKATICGVSSRLFWLTMAAIGLFVAIGVGVGVGVGLGARHKAVVQPSPTTSSAPGSHTSTSTSSKTASPTESLPPSLLGCPQANNTRYAVPGLDKTFLLNCGIDYTGAGQAVEVGNLYTADMEDCMANCATFPGCTGAGWGIIPGDAGSEHRCWLKGDLGKKPIPKPGWYFAILQ
ncbi:hypothetical protein ACHAPE_008485 [Trichoderma viride]